MLLLDKVLRDLMYDLAQAILCSCLTGSPKRSMCSTTRASYGEELTTR